MHILLSSLESVKLGKRNWGDGAGKRFLYYSPSLATFPKLQKAVSWCGQQSRKEAGTATAGRRRRIHSPKQ